METGGLWMLLSVAILLLATGLPAYAVLMGVSAIFATLGVLGGGIEFGLLTTFGGRLQFCGSLLQSSDFSSSATTSFIFRHSQMHTYTSSSAASLESLSASSL